MNGRRLAIFDCDGTLVDGQAEVCTAMEAAFAELGLAPPPRHDVRRIVGLSLPAAMVRLAPHADASVRSALDAAYRRQFRATREAGRLVEPLFEGIRELLDALLADGWLLGVATGKSARGLAHCLEVHGLSRHFVTLQTADNHPSKPDPAMLESALFETATDRGNAVMIGDTVYDIHMARSAAVKSIGVGWGYHAPEELVEAGAIGVARDCTELSRMLREVS
jgi:phosphoglycolate phosphatase